MAHLLTAAPSLEPTQAEPEARHPCPSCVSLPALPSLFLVWDWDNLTVHFHQRPGPGSCLIYGLGVLVLPFITWPWADPYPGSEYGFSHREDRRHPALDCFVRSSGAAKQVAPAEHLLCAGTEPSPPR